MIIDVEDAEADAAAFMNERFGPGVRAARDHIADANDRIRELVRRHPGKSLAAALLLGYVVARIARRLGGRS